MCPGYCINYRALYTSGSMRQTIINILPKRRDLLGDAIIHSQPTKGFAKIVLVSWCSPARLLAATFRLPVRLSGQALSAKQYSIKLSSSPVKGKNYQFHICCYMDLLMFEAEI